MKFGLIFETQLTQQANYIITQVGKIATSHAQSVYLVGGAVRDVLLERSSNDLDFVTEGDGIQLAQAVCKELGGELTTHERFGTAVWTPPAELFLFTIDFITARKEIYPHPATLPQVTPSHMGDDLLRRDFTVNALAVRLDGQHFGELLDNHGGQTDLENKRIRILHAQSFADDPTRIFRALRYAGRLGFELSNETASALQKDKNKIELLSADRLRHEFEKILGEADPENILESLSNLGILAQISKQMKWTNKIEVAFEQLKGLIQTEPGKTATKESGLIDLRFLTWICTSEMPEQAAKDFIQALNFSANLRQDTENILHFLQPNQRPANRSAPGTIEKAFRRLSAAQLTILQVVDYLPASIKESIKVYFTDWRHIKTFIDGKRLKQMGLSPGPNFKIILDALLAAKLNGTLKTQQDETQFVEDFISSA